MCETIWDHNPYNPKVIYSFYTNLKNSVILWLSRKVNIMTSFWRISISMTSNVNHLVKGPLVDEQNGVDFMFLSSLQPKLLPKMWFWPFRWPWPWPLTLMSENERFVIFCLVLMINIQYNAQWRQFIVNSRYHHVTLAKYHKILTPWTLTPTELENKDR